MNAALRYQKVVIKNNMLKYKELKHFHLFQLVSPNLDVLQRDDSIWCLFLSRRATSQ